MIVLRLKGGLGNQLFIYVFGLYLKERKNENIIFDQSPYFKLLSNKYNNFSKKYFITLSLNKFFNYRSVPNLIGKFLFKLAKLNKYYFNLSLLPFFYSEEEICKDYNKKELKGLFKCINGHFINKDYALKLSKKLILPSIDISKKNKKYLKEIEYSNSVSIHIRGSQYVNYEEIKSTYAPIDKKYYKKSIEIINKYVINPKFFVFTNDLKYAISVMDFDKNIIFIETNGPDYEHFYMMSRCKHNIIINSTFSWWAAFFNENNKKLVICPSKWSGEVLVNQYYDALPLDNYIKVNNLA